jgi:hypothetical protein
MGLLSIFGPGYLQKDPAVRKASIARLTLAKKDILENLANNDPDQGVRETAKARLEALAPKK